MSTRLRKTLILAVKVVIAAALLAWVFGQVHWHDHVQDLDGKEYDLLADARAGEAPALRVSRGALWWKTELTLPLSRVKRIGDEGVYRRMGFASAVSRIKPLWMSLAAAAFPLCLLVIACRWWLLLRLQEIHIPLWEAVRLTFLGQFFNAAVPGTVGGDLVKAYYVAKHTTRTAGVLVSIFIDRVMGLTELTILAAVMTFVVWAARLASFQEIRLPLITVGIVSLALTLALVFVFSRSVRRVLHLQKLYQNLWIARYVSSLSEAVGIYRSRAGRLVQAILITFGAHVVWVGSVALIGASLSLAMPWYSYFLYIPLIYIIGAVPLTPGGIGLIEQFYLVFFFAGNPSEILALALLARLVPMFWGLPGAVVAVTGPKLPKAEKLQAELGLRRGGSE